MHSPFLNSDKCPVCNIALVQKPCAYDYSKLHCDLCNSSCLLNNIQIIEYIFFFPQYTIYSSFDTGVCDDETPITALYKRTMNISELLFTVNKFIPINSLNDIESLVSRLLKLKALS